MNAVLEVLFVAVPPARCVAWAGLRGGAPKILIRALASRAAASGAARAHSGEAPQTDRRPTCPRRPHLRTNCVLDLAVLARTGGITSRGDGSAQPGQVPASFQTPCAWARGGPRLSP